MTNSKAKFNNQKLFSNKIHSRILKAALEISISLRKLEITNDEFKAVFLNSVNHFYGDLNAVIFQLRQFVIKIDNDDGNVRVVVRNIITELSKIALSIQESLNWETEKLKIHLEGTVVDVSSQVEKLMKIIECDDLQDCKQNFLDTQLDLLISIESLKLFIQHPNQSLLDLESLLHDTIERLKNNLNQIKTGFESQSEEFSHYTRHCAQRMQNALDYMRKMNNTENFQTDITSIFKHAEVYGNGFIGNLLEAADHENPIKQMLGIIDNCHKNVGDASVDFQRGLQSIKGDDKRVKQLIIHLFIKGISGMDALNHSIEDSFMRK